MLQNSTDPTLYRLPVNSVSQPEEDGPGYHRGTYRYIVFYCSEKNYRTIDVQLFHFILCYCISWKIITIEILSLYIVTPRLRISTYTPYNGILIFHGTGSGKSCSAITIAESYKNTIIKNGKKILIILSKSVKNNFLKEIHDINKGYNQCTFSEYINYNIYSSDRKKEEKAKTLIEKYKYKLKGTGNISFHLG